MQNQIQFYENKLAYEMDPSDLFDALEKEENIVVVDARQSFGYKKEHIPTAINLPLPAGKVGKETPGEKYTTGESEGRTGKGQP